MKNLSIRLKITLWFSSVLVVVVCLTFGAVISASGSVIQKTIRDGLVTTVEDNVDEIEYFRIIADTENDNDDDLYIAYEDGFLEIDDDFLDQVNGITTGLYQSDGTLLYGENPIAAHTGDTGFADAALNKITVESITYYIYDRQLIRSGLEGLWLRGVVSQEQGKPQMSALVGISLILLPLLVIAAICGGYLTAGRALRPIQEIAGTAARIGQGRDLKRRIALGPGKDELHRLAEAFDEMFERLDKAFEKEKQFASDVSHELRTPMAVIMAQCEYALEQPMEEAEYREALQVIRRQGKKMSELIEDMLSFARLEGKTDSFQMEEIDFTKLVTDLCQDMSWLLENGITLSWETEENVKVKGNRELLVRLLTNLIGNAYRYGRKNGWIKVTLRKEAAGVRLAVEDNGIGISLREQKKIFDRFYQADTARSGEGTGLGLSMAQEIAKLHGGEIQVESSQEKGSCFTVILKAEN